LQEYEVCATIVRCPSQARYKTAQSTQPSSLLVKLVPSERMLCYSLLMGLLADIVSRGCWNRSGRETCP